MSSFIVEKMGTLGCAEAMRKVMESKPEATP